MSINSVGSSSQSVSSVSSTQQQDFQQLSSALQSGNLSAAQSVYQALVGNNTPPSNSPLGQLGQALQSGNLSAAQQAFQTLQSAHGHHHHHSSDQTAATSSGSTSSPPSSGTVGTVVNTAA